MHRLKTLRFLAAAVAAIAVSTPLHAQTTAPAAPASMTDGEVRKIDKENRKITLKHEEIKNLQMPGMTMVFQVKDPAVLDTVKTGDKVRFSVERTNGALTITRIEAAK